MKRLHFFLLTITPLLLLSPELGAAEKSVQWEYRIFPFKASLEGLTAKAGADGSAQAKRQDPVVQKMEETLNKLGAEGWELSSESGGVLIFKRQKAS